MLAGQWRESPEGPAVGGQARLAAVAAGAVGGAGEASEGRPPIGERVVGGEESSCKNS